MLLFKPTMISIIILLIVLKRVSIKLLNRRVEGDQDRERAIEAYLEGDGARRA
jgi:hypothetical protein